MSDDLQRRVKQLERMVATLMRELEGVRNQRQPATGLIQPVLAIPGSNIAPKSENLEDSSAFDVAYGAAALWDISPMDGSNVGLMKAAGVTIKIGNPWDAAVTAGNLTLCVPYKQHYLVAAEQCDPE